MERLEQKVDWAGKVYQRMHGTHFGKGPKNYRRTDEKIKDEVCEALYRSYDVDATNVDVDVRNGVVFLKGKVLDRGMKKLAEDCVENVSGVRDVSNQLTFEKNYPIIHRSDSEPEDELGTRLT